MKRFVAALVLLAIALGALLYNRLAAQRAALTAPAGGSGVVEGTRVSIASRLGARIVRVTAREGDAVEPGQVLVELDCTEPKAALAQAQAAVAAAEASAHAAAAAVEAAQRAAEGAQHGVEALQAKVTFAARSARRVATLRAGGQASRQKLDEARATVKALRAQRRAAEAKAQAAAQQVEVARAKAQAAADNVARARAARDRAAAMVEECTLRSPTGGIVQVRATEPGEVARPGMPLLVLVDLREVTATFYLPNAELAAARPGRRVEVRADAWPGRVWKGTIARVGAEAAFTPRNVQTRTDRDRLVYPVEVRLANEDGALRPGMPVEVTIPGTGGPRGGSR